MWEGADMIDVAYVGIQGRVTVNTVRGASGLAERLLGYQSPQNTMTLGSLLLTYLLTHSLHEAESFFRS